MRTSSVLDEAMASVRRCSLVARSWEAPPPTVLPASGSVTGMTGSGLGLFFELTRGRLAAVPPLGNPASGRRNRAGYSVARHGDGRTLVPPVERRPVAGRPGLLQPRGAQ